MYEPSHALGLIRRDIAGCPDRWRELLKELAERHGFRLVFTVELHAGPCIANLALAQHITEHSAAAVVVLSFGHADAVRHMITGVAALITPVRVYPRGYRWPVAEAGEGL